jgi:adenosine deaminase
MIKNKIIENMKSFPKVDLHRHLEGSVRPETFIEVSKKYGGKLPSYDLDELRPLLQVDPDCCDFKSFFSKFNIYRDFYESSDAIQEVAYRSVKDAALDSVKYLELRFSPTHFAVNKRFNESDVISWLKEAIELASKDYNIIVTPILTISRDFGLEMAEKTVNLVLQMQDRFFCGLDIAGNETTNSVKPFKALFKKVKDAGMGLTVHAGEVGDPSNVREAVVDFYADRIGHGIRSIEDENLMDFLRDRDVMLEVCITSNLHTGVVKSLNEHPLKKIKNSGVPFCLNTDDPAVSDLCLTDEYCKAVAEFGFTVEDLNKMNISALDHAFYPDKDFLKKKMSSLWE